MIVVSVFLSKSVDLWYYQRFVNDIQNAVNNEGIKDAQDMTMDKIIKKLDNNKYVLKGDYRNYKVIDINTLDMKPAEKSSDQEDFKNEILGSRNFIRACSGGKGEVGNSSQLNRYGNQEYYDYAESVTNQFILYFRYDRKEQQKTTNDFYNIILMSSLVAVAASLILGLVLSRYITVPIGNVVQKARKIAAGDFDEVVDVKSFDEIGELTSTFNYMAGELKNKLIEISSEKSKVETILNYMTDGVAAFNLKGEIIHVNPAFRKIMGDEDLNKSFNEFTKLLGIDLSLESIIFLRKHSIDERFTSLNAKSFRVNFAVFTDEDDNIEGIIAVLHDVTEQQRLDNMRKEFVANVSHELRTPLTSVKTYSETLIDGAIDDRETALRFLGVINQEADRMTRLVKDLLQLSRLDNDQLLLRITDVDLVHMVKSCVERLDIEARSRKQTLESFVIGDIPLIHADRDRIEQVILNILSNAIKYTQDGGKITVYTGKSFNSVYVKVTDTGIGIPKEDLPRIFERFYRVDKARSREMGGTGLGLAIAKEITEAHGGTILISSEYGKGTEVTIKLPM
ncbi:MAG TPA: ATP-binding protein [Clostridia bacterium]